MDFYILQVFNFFEDEIGNVRTILESQSGWNPNEDMQMSYAPSFSAPGGHIFYVVAQELNKHVFRAMLAQHVASELRMRLWTLIKVSN